MITEKNARETESGIRHTRGFIAFLPWIIAGVAAVVYLATLNPWVSANSITQVARISGWSWKPDLYNPLYLSLTYPLRYLPARFIPLALNVFSVVCASLTLALLARSVSLLPHDRTHQQRLRETSDFSLLSIPLRWVPPVVAAIVCGLQLTFWENATVASNEMLDLLIFAYIIRNLLEYRVLEKEHWLFRAALVYGLAIPNNWAMMGFFPLFLVALVWIKGLGFFNLRFLGIMAVCGLAGLLLYLVLPLTQFHNRFVPVPFWDALRANIRGQRGLLGLFLNKSAVLHGDHPLWVLSLFALVPLLLIAIRWPSYFGDTSRMGVGIATSILNLLYAFFLLVCVWVSFDPRPSPRNYRGGMPALLTFYYLSALCIGYFTAYFLLVFGTVPSRMRRVSSMLRTLNRTVLTGLWIVLAVAPLVLLYRNLPQIRLTNGTLLKDFSSLLAEPLPAQGALILSDDPRRTLFLKAAMVRKKTDGLYTLVDTAWLRWPQYHAYLRSLNHDSWPAEAPKSTKRLTDNDVAFLVNNAVKSNSVYYLHPSFGYYFEMLYQEPHGLAYKLLPFPANTMVTPALTKEVSQENENFWERAVSNELKPLLSALHPNRRAGGFVDTVMARAHLDPIVNRDMTLLAGLYSRAIDYWGVEMQKQNRLKEAAQHFTTALDLNGDNVVAQVNLDCNKSLQEGRKPTTKISKSIEDQFGKYRTWEEVMSENGPFDEPDFCFEQGRLHARFQLYRQAATQFARTVELDPYHLEARLWLSQLYVLNDMPDEGIKLINPIHSQPQNFSIHKTNLTEILFVEASAYCAKKDFAGAQEAVRAALEKHPDDEDILATAAHVFITYGNYSNALAIIDRQIKATPDNPKALVNKGYACIQLSNYKDAIPPLTKALTLETNNPSALLNLAIAYLRSDQLPEAQGVYEKLQKEFPTSYPVYFGLGEIAYRNKDTNAAVRNYQLYLTNSPPNNPEAQFITGRLHELQPGTQ